MCHISYSQYFPTPKQFGGQLYLKLFLRGVLDKSLHPILLKLRDMRVSAHCLIKRDGRKQFQICTLYKGLGMPGKSSFQAEVFVNDYSLAC